MEITFADEDDDRLESDLDAKSKFDEKIVRSYRGRLRVIRDAVDERDLFAIFGPKNYYCLKGSRSHQHAIRLNDQWRLVIEIVKGNPKNTIRVIGIKDYH